MTDPKKVRETGTNKLIEIHQHLQTTHGEYLADQQWSVKSEIQKIFELCTLLIIKVKWKQVPILSRN